MSEVNVVEQFVVYFKPGEELNVIFGTHIDEGVQYTNEPDDIERVPYWDASAFLYGLPTSYEGEIEFTKRSIHIVSPSHQGSGYRRFTLTVKNLNKSDPVYVVAKLIRIRT